MSLRYLSRSFLVLSLGAVGLFGALTPAHACDCVGEQCPPRCSESNSSSQQTLRIQYTIINNTDQVVRFGLPSGRTYTLASGQRGSYRNTGTQDNLGIFILNTSQRYQLSNGDFQFRENSDGEIIFSYFD